MHPENDVDAATLRVRDDPVIAEESIGQSNITGLELATDLTEQSQFTGLFALVGPDGSLQHRPHSQADDQENARNRETEPGFLTSRLWVHSLVGFGVWHDDCGAVEELDGKPDIQPSAGDSGSQTSNVRPGRKSDARPWLRLRATRQRHWRQCCTTSDLWNGAVARVAATILRHPIFSRHA